MFVEERIRQLAGFLVQEPRSQLRGFMSHEIRKTDALGVKPAGDQAQRIQELRFLASDETSSSPLPTLF